MTTLFQTESVKKAFSSSGSRPLIINSFFADCPDAHWWAGTRGSLFPQQSETPIDHRPTRPRLARQLVRHGDGDAAETLRPGRLLDREGKGAWKRSQANPSTGRWNSVKEGRRRGWGVTPVSGVGGVGGGWLCIPKVEKLGGAQMYGDIYFYTQKEPLLRKRNIFQCPSLYLSRMERNCSIK